MQPLPMSRDCLVCGRENPIGLRVRFQPAGAGVEAAVQPPPSFQGYPGVLHGGLVSALLDDAMWWAIYAVHRAVTMTAEMNVRFRQPAPVDQELRVWGEVTASRSGRLFVTAAKLFTPDGTVLAEATGKFLAAPPELASQLIRGME